jgi:hypothetical protein
MALVYTLVATVVMGIVMASSLSYTVATATDAYVKRSEQSAYSLAEAGVNQALAQLASHYYDTSNSANNTSTSFLPSWITGGTTSQQSPASTAPCTSGSTCMSWSLVSCSFYSVIPGCTTLSGNGGIKKGTIVLRGTGTMPNPTHGAPLTSSVTASIDVSQPSKLVDTPPFWSEIYAGAPASLGCDLTLSQGVTVGAPLYVAGNLCLTQTAQVAGSGASLKVFGWVSLKNSSFIGTAASPISSAQIAGGCPDGALSLGCTINKTGGSIWDSSPSTHHSAVAPTVQPLPSVDWAYMQNAQANSTPAASCAAGKSLSDLTFDLTPAFSYSCTSAIGSISYAYGSPATLTVSGDVYFSGNLSIGNATVKYTGLGSFFVAGAVTGSNSGDLCVAIASGTCDFANANVVGSPGYWNTTQNVLLLHAQGAITATNFRFQGGMYSAASINLGGGQSKTQGPLVTPGPLTVGQQLNGTFPSIPQVQAGSLGTPPPAFTLGKPYGRGF